MQNEIPARIAPLPPSEWDSTALDALGAFPKSLEFVWSRWQAGERDVKGMHVLGVMARHAPLAKAFMTFNAHVSGASTLSVRVRELVILRISWLQHSEYEFVQHLILGRRAGLTDQEMERVQAGPDAAGWDPADADLIRAVDELHGRARIGNATWARLSAHLSVPQLMDLVFVVGCYAILAMAINSFDISLEAGLVPLDPRASARLQGQQ
jgi:alkylhydroperoxidase family enzyme